METAETNTIEIVVNGDMRRVPQRLNITGLLAFLEIEASRVAVELNRRIVRKTDWNTTPIESGASVEVVWFVGGG